MCSSLKDHSSKMTSKAVEYKNRYRSKSSRRMAGLFKSLHRLPTKFVKDCGFIPVVLINTAAVVERHIRTREIFQTQGTSSKAIASLNMLGSGRGGRGARHLTVHDAIEAMKLVLVSLPEPLIPEDVCDQLITASKQGCGSHYGKILTRFRMKSPLNFGILHFMMILLRKVSLHTQYNQMDVRKLATIFVLDVIKPLKLDDPNDGEFLSERMQRLPYLIMVVEKLIINVDIFKNARAKKKPGASLCATSSSADSSNTPSAPGAPSTGDRALAGPDSRPSYPGGDQKKSSCMEASRPSRKPSHTRPAKLIIAPFSSTTRRSRLSSRYASGHVTKNAGAIGVAEEQQAWSPSVNISLPKHLVSSPTPTPAAAAAAPQGHNSCDAPSGRCLPVDPSLPPPAPEVRAASRDLVSSARLHHSQRTSSAGIQSRQYKTHMHSPAKVPHSIDKSHDTECAAASNITKTSCSACVQQDERVKDSVVIPAKSAKTKSLSKSSSPLGKTVGTRAESLPQLEKPIEPNVSHKRGRACSWSGRGASPRRNLQTSRGKVGSFRAGKQGSLCSSSAGFGKRKRKRKVGGPNKKSEDCGDVLSGAHNSSERSAFRRDEAMSPWPDEGGSSDDLSLMTRTIRNPRVLPVSPPSGPATSLRARSHRKGRHGRVHSGTQCPPAGPKGISGYRQAFSSPPKPSPTKECHFRVISPGQSPGISVAGSSMGDSLLPSALSDSPVAALPPLPATSASPCRPHLVDRSSGDGSRAEKKGRKKSAERGEAASDVNCDSSFVGSLVSKGRRYFCSSPAASPREGEGCTSTTMLTSGSAESVGGSPSEGESPQSEQLNTSKSCRRSASPDTLGADRAVGDAASSLPPPHSGSNGTGGSEVKGQDMTARAAVAGKSCKNQQASRRDVPRLKLLHRVWRRRQRLRQQELSALVAGRPRCRRVLALILTTMAVLLVGYVTTTGLHH